MKIKNINIKNNVFLAPMAGYTDIGFRTLAKEYGAGATCTEMVSAEAIKYGNKKTLKLLEIADCEKPAIVQIFGKSPSVMSDIVASEVLNKFDIIDINMGCPAPKIVNNGEGSALMKNIELAEKIVRACVSNTNKPITVKFRKGWDDNSVNAVDFAQMCERAGASAITIHGRTREQGYSGKCDWNIIKEVVQSVNIPVIANGDIQNKSDSDEIQKYTGCAGVMLGRGVLGKPYIFNEWTKLNKEYNLLDIIKKHIKILLESHTERFVVLNMRKHLAYYLKDIPGNSQMKTELFKKEKISEVIQTLEIWLKH